MKKVFQMIFILAIILSCTITVFSKDIPAFSEEGKKVLVLEGKSAFLKRKYNPDKPIKRSEFVSLINRTFNFKEKDTENFEDVSPHTTYANDFLIAKKANYLDVDDNNLIRPTDDITRAEAAVIVSKVCQLSLYNPQIVLDTNDSHPEWANASIRAVIENEFIHLEKGMFNADSVLSKGEAYYIMEKIFAENYNSTRKDTVLEIPSFDNYILEGRLSVPSNKGTIDKLVIFVNGSGPSTYLNTRSMGGTRFNYFDLFAKEFTRKNTAFFSYSTRGVNISDNPPLFGDINKEEYKNYLPSVQVKDIKEMIKYLKNKDELKNAKIYLLGWSEGTSIVPLVALDKELPIDAILLSGYYNDNLSDVLKFQLSGGSSMVNMKMYFNVEDKDYLTKEDFEKDPNHMRLSLFGTSEFKDLDVNSDDKIDSSDFKIMIGDTWETTLNAINTNDDNWLEKNYPIRLTSAWFNEHFALKPNNETLPQIDIPIFIFQGTHDANTPVEQAYDIMQTFKIKGKTNLTVNIFEKHDHDLNYTMYPIYNHISEGIKSIFETVNQL